MKFKLWLTTILLVIGVSAHALSIRTDHPKEYVVQEGDSLWSIAEQFLERPWEWEKLWSKNPQIKNPNKIYPGSVIRFSDKQGRPYLELVRRRTIHLSPRARKQPLLHPIPPIPMELIKPFLNRSLVMEEDFLKFSPYVIGFSEEHFIGSENSHIFVANLHGRRDQNFTIYRQDGLYRDQKNKQILGYAAKYIADVRLVKSGEPATVIASELKHSVHIGDRLLLKRPDPFLLDFVPHPPRRGVEGQIINIFGGLKRAGNNQVVVINRGRTMGIYPGDVMAVVRKGKRVVDPVSKLRKVNLPDERVAEIMVFRTFKNVSFALAMKAWSPISVDDHIQAP